MYFNFHPSDPIPPCFCGVIKAHKPEENYPAVRTIVSTINTSSYGISEYLVEIMQPTLGRYGHLLVIHNLLK